MLFIPSNEIFIPLTKSFNQEYYIIIYLPKDKEWHSHILTFEMQEINRNILHNICIIGMLI